jgi:hypothetical protein
MLRWGIASALAAGMFCVAPASAADLPPAPPVAAPLMAAPAPWQFQATIYGWATGLSGDVGVGKLPSASVDASFIDILRHLDGVFMGSFIARNDSFIVGGDLVWSRLGDSLSFKANGDGPFADLRPGTSVSATQNMTIATGFAGYRIPLGSPDMSLYGTVGARYQNLTLDVDLTHRNYGRSFQQTKNWIDPVLGFAMNYRIDEKWFLNALGDIGGFGVGSKVTTQGLVAVGYNWTSSFSTSLGYRALYTDYQKGNSAGGSFRWNTTLYGPFMAFNYNF